MKSKDARTVLVERTEAFLEDLPPRSLERLLRRLGIAPGARPAKAALAVVQALEAGAAPRALVTDLPDSAQHMLAYYVLRALRPEARPYDWDGGAYPPLPEVEARAGRAALVEHGLLAEGYDGERILPALVPSLAEEAVRASVAELDTEPPKDAPIGFQLALIAAQHGVDSVPLTRAGAPHARSAERIEKALARGIGVPLARLVAEVVLRRTAVLVPRGTADGRVLALDARALLRLLRLSAHDLALACFWAPNEMGPHLRVLAQILAVEGRSPTGEARRAAFRDVLEQPMPCVGHGGTPDWYRPAADGWALRGSLLVLHRFGLVARAAGDGPPAVRSCEPRAHGDGRWVVQPSYDVLVPWDVPPERVAALACFAELEAFDRVCRFRLTQASVGRGLLLLGSDVNLPNLLEQGAAAPLSQNVRATLEGWVERHRPLRAACGEFVLEPDPEQLALLRRACPEAQEVAPGVWLLQPAGLSEVQKAARKAGMPLAPVLGLDEGQHLDRDVLTPDLAAQRTRKTLQQLAAARAPARTAAPRARGDLSQAELERALHDILQGKFPAGLADDEGGEDDDEDWEEDEDDALPGGGAKSSGTALRGPAVWFPPEERGHAKPAAPAPRASALDPSSVAWTSPLPGVLRQRLTAAMAGKAEVRMLYRNSEDRIVERRVIPMRLYSTPKGEYVDARDVERGAQCTLVVDRITGIAT